MDRIFFSRNNYNLIYNIVGEKIYDKFKYDIAKNKMFENEIIRIMKTVYGKRKTLHIDPNLSPQKYSNELSKNVLNISINDFSKFIREGESSSSPQPTDNIIPNQEQRLKGRQNYVDSRPQPSVIHEKNDVHKMYEELQQDRSFGNASSRPITKPTFQEDTTNIRYSDINNDYDALSKEREQDHILPNNNHFSNQFRKPNNFGNNNNQSHNNDRPNNWTQQRNDNGRQQDDNNRQQSDNSRWNDNNRQQNDNNRQQSDNSRWNDNNRQQDDNNRQQSDNSRWNDNNRQQGDNNRQQDDNQNLREESSSSSEISGFGSENNLNENSLPGFGDNTLSGGGIDSMFQTMSNDDQKKLQTKFESQSIQDRLKQFEINKQQDDDNFERKLQQSSSSQTQNQNQGNQKNQNQMKNNIQQEIQPKNEHFGNPPPTQRNEREQQRQSHPKEFFSNPLKFNGGSAAFQGNKLDQYYETPVKNVPNPSQPEFNVETFNLVINSLDRQWYGQISKTGDIYGSPFTQRYKYTVNFSPSADSYINVPIYENNEYIPLNIDLEEDKIKIRKGLRDKNTSGFTYKGNSYSSYNSTKKKGNVVGYERWIVQSGNSSVSTDKSFKNVVSVKLKRLILPNNDRFFSIYDSDATTTIDVPIGYKNEPYIFVNINEFSSNVITTNNVHKSIFCKTHFDKEFCYKESTCLTRGFLYYCNSDNDIKNFQPAPLSELTKMTIELLNPDGTIYSTIHDDLQINRIELSGPFVILTLNKYVNKKYFQVGDKVIVKSLLSTASVKIPPALINYLECGATIFKLGTANTDGNLNTIYLQKKLTSIDSSGNNVYFKGVDLGGVYASCLGFIINATLQHSLVLEIKVQTTNNLIKPRIV